jgi:hypothetical protein
MPRSSKAEDFDEAIRARLEDVYASREPEPEEPESRPPVAHAEVSSIAARLQAGSRKEKRKALDALGKLTVLAEDVGILKETQAAFREAGCVAPLVALARDGRVGDQQWRSSYALAMIAANNQENQTAIREAGGLEVLVGLMRDGTGGERKWALVGLAHLANSNAENQAGIVQAGGLPVLAALSLNEGTAEEQPYAAAVLQTLARAFPDVLVFADDQ